MRISVETRAAAAGKARRPLDLLAVPLARLDPAGWQPPARLQALDRALSGRLGEAVASGDFLGKRGQTLLLYGDESAGARRVLLVGTGEEGQLDVSAVLAFDDGQHS